MNKKALIFAVIVVLVAIVASVVVGFLVSSYIVKSTKKTINAFFDCNNNENIKVTFYKDDPQKVSLQLSDGRYITLNHAVSADGARYTNDDESFVFWNKGSIAFIQENNQTTFANCVIQGSTETPGVQTVSDGKITMIFYDQNFGLAVTPEQILVKSYIPACDQNFDYCIYYNSDTYKGTNFESAGLRILNRKDLTTQSTCLNTPPDGHDSSFKPDKNSTNDYYSISEFSNVGQGAAGHYTTGSLYRMFIKGSSSCYEFETRVGESRFANYPSGTIQEFTDYDRSQAMVQLNNILEGITINGTPAVLMVQ